jgi:predicted dehydrogenase
LRVLRKARFGVIGVGTWGENHVRAYGQNPQAEMVAISDINEEETELSGRGMELSTTRIIRSCSRTKR